jgi:hypothetical protein
MHCTPYPENYLPSCEHAIIVCHVQNIGWQVLLSHLSTSKQRAHPEGRATLRQHPFWIIDVVIVDFSAVVALLLYVQVSASTLLLLKLGSRWNFLAARL